MIRSGKNKEWIRYAVCAAVVVIISLITACMPDNGVILRNQTKSVPVYRVEREYSDGGLVLSEWTVDDEGNRVADRSDSIAEVRYEYDGMQYVSRESYYGPDGNPASAKGGYASVSYEYDRNGNRAVIRYYDEEGEPAALLNGYAEVRYEYDAGNRKISEVYYDKNGEEVVLNTGRTYVALVPDDIWSGLTIE